MWLDEIDGTPGPNGTPPLNVDDVELWRRTNPGWMPGASGKPRITERARRKDRRTRGRLGYAREALCIWPRPVAAAGTAIDPDQWGARADIESRPGPELVFAIDVAPGARSAAIAVSGRRADGRMHIKVMDYRAGTEWIGERLSELVARGRPKATMINSSGPAGAVYDELTAAGFALTKVEGGEWARACAAFLADVEQDRMRHCGQDGLDDAVACATRKFVGDGAWYWSRKDSTGDICPLAAVTAAAHGFRIHGAAEGRILAIGFGPDPDAGPATDRGGDGRSAAAAGPEPVVVPRGPTILPRGRR